MRGRNRRRRCTCRDAWADRGVLGDIDVEFRNAGGVLFGVTEYVPALMEYAEKYGIDLKLNQTLVAVDGPGKDRHVSNRSQGGNGRVRQGPCRSPASRPACSLPIPLAQAESGFVDIDPITLRHVRYPNVFGLGDAGSSPNAKTAAAVRKQALIAAVNALVVLDDKQPVAALSGIMLAVLGLLRMGFLAAVAATIVQVLALDLGARGVNLVGAIPQGLPPFALPSTNPDLIAQLRVPALLISIIGFVESVSVSRRWPPSAASGSRRRAPSVGASATSPARVGRLSRHRWCRSVAETLKPLRRVPTGSGGYRDDECKVRTVGRWRRRRVDRISRRIDCQTFAHDVLQLLKWGERNTAEHAAKRKIGVVAELRRSQLGPNTPNTRHTGLLHSCPSGTGIW